MQQLQLREAEVQEKTVLIETLNDGPLALLFKFTGGYVRYYQAPMELNEVDEAIG